MDPQLLERYWNGETSLQEEQEILNEMTSTPSADAMYFIMIAEARRQKSKLKIDDIHAFNLKTVTTQAAPARIVPLQRWLASAAAVVLFAIAGFGLWNYTHKTQQSAVMADSFEDPYAAYEEVREALAFVSAKLNKSQSEALLNIKKAETYADMFK